MLVVLVKFNCAPHRALTDICQRFNLYFSLFFHLHVYNHSTLYIHVYKNLLFYIMYIHNKLLFILVFSKKLQPNHIKQFERCPDNVKDILFKHLEDIPSSTDIMCILQLMEAKRHVTRVYEEYVEKEP